MKTAIVMAAIGWVLFIGVTVTNCQTVSPTPNPRDEPRTVTQGYLDDSAKAFLLVVELRDALVKAQTASAAGDATHAARAVQIQALNELIAIFERKDGVYQSLLDLRDQAFVLYEKMMKIQADMIDRLVTQLNKGKSGWDKFLDGFKKAVTFVVGIIIGKRLGI